MPVASVHAVAPLAATARAPPHHAPHSYLRYDSATGHATRCTPYRHSPRPHARLSTAPHAVPRDTPVTQAIRRSAHAVAPLAATACTPLHRAPHSYPRYAGATCRLRRCMPYRHAPRPHDPSRPPMRTPGGHTLRLRDGGGSACCARCAQQWRFMYCSCAATAVHEALVALLDLLHAPRAQIQLATPSRRRA